MDNKKKRGRHYTFVVIPHDSTGRPISFKLPLKVVYGLVGLFIFSFILIVSSLVYSSHLSRKLVFYSKALSHNRQQQKVIDQFSDKTKKVEQAIFELAKMDKNLRKTLGLKSWRGKIKLVSSEDNPEKKLQQAQARLDERKKSFIELKSWVKTVQQRYSSLPSRWPIYGRLVSRYGYRSYPWRGFHSGIDITGRYGAPIYATADGTVKFVGWRKGYGKTVIVDHGRGYSTLYGHNSKYAVKVGQNVKKGQTICYIGATGLTTGPHVHYEVRRYNKTVNPVAYLNLNILSASKMWRR